MADKGLVFFDGATDTLAGGDPVELTGAGPVVFTAESATGASHLVIEISYKDNPYAWLVGLDTDVADGVVFYGDLPVFVRGRVTGTVGPETWIGRAVVNKSADEVASEAGEDACAGVVFQGGAKFSV